MGVEKGFAGIDKPGNNGANSKTIEPEHKREGTAGKKTQELRDEKRPRRKPAREK